MSERGQGYGVSLPYYTASVLYIGLGRYSDAMASAELASEQRDDLAFANLALAELIEAAVRGGQPERAAAAMRRLTELTLPSGTAWGLESRHAPARCSARATRPSGCTVRRSVI